MIKILVEAQLDFKLEDLATGELREFLIDRIKYYFREVRGYKYDEVAAVLAPGISEVSDMEARLAALAAIRPTEDFEPLAASCKRIRNILKQANFTPHEDAALDLDTDTLEEPDRVLESEYGRVNVFSFTRPITIWPLSRPSPSFRPSGG